jgi:hypothetical protein
MTITQRLVFSVMVFTMLLGNIFQQRTVLCSRAPHRLVAISHQTPTLLTDNSRHYCSAADLLPRTWTVSYCLLPNFNLTWTPLSPTHLPGGNSLIMVAIPHYAALEWTSQKTPSTTALLLWCDCCGGEVFIAPSPSNTCVYTAIP